MLYQLSYTPKAEWFRSPAARPLQVGLAAKRRK